MDIQNDDFALIEWNGGMYRKSQHYHILENNKTKIKVRVPGSNIKIEIPKNKISKIEKIELLKENI